MIFHSASGMIAATFFYFQAIIWHISGYIKSHMTAVAKTISAGYRKTFRIKPPWRMYNQDPMTSPPIHNQTSSLQFISEKVLLCS